MFEKKLVPFNTLTLPANNKGRDIVIGDLRGHFNRFEEVLIKVKFDPSADRVFSVGGLCDPGPDSLRCLQLKSSPWFFSVMGNPEAEILDYIQYSKKFGFSDNARRQRYLDRLTKHEYMRDRWITEYLCRIWHDSAALEELEHLVSLPHLIRVEDTVTPYQIVHANVFDARWTSDSIIDDLINDGYCTKRKLTSFLNGYFFLQDAKLLHRDEPQLIEPGLRMTLSGQHMTGNPARYRSHIFIGSGCGYKDSLCEELSAFIVSEDKFLSVGINTRY